MNINDIFTIIHETGIPWIFFRTMYIAKLKMLQIFPKFEKIFERRAVIKRVDIFEPDVESIEKFLLDLSLTDKQSIIQCADNALEGKIIAFSSALFDYGNPIDWQKNPYSNVCIDKTKKWYTIPDFDENNGDIKAVWEISRFSHLYFFLRAYMLTKDKKYYDGYRKQITLWLQENPYSYGANYKCGQECALRIMNVLAVYGGFKKYGLITSEANEIISQFVKVNYKKIQSNFFYAHRCVKIDHLISELCGLIICAWCSEDNVKLRKYFTMLNKQMVKQFNEKGMYVSYSLNYQRYVMQMMAYMIKILPKLEKTIAPDVRVRLVNAALLYNIAMGQNGMVPNYGPNDGTLIFPLTVCEFSDFRPIVNTILGLLTGETFFETGTYSEEFLWFTNSQGALKKISPDMPHNTIDGSGFYVLEKNGIKIILNAHEYERRPGHMDQLHFDLWIEGKNIFCDTGTYSYALPLGEHLRGNEGHNVVCVNGAEQMKRCGHFLNYAIPKIKILSRSENKISCRARFATGYMHERMVELENKIIMISDTIKCKSGITDYSILFHTPYKVQTNNGQLNIVKPDGRVICTLRNSGGNVTVEKEYASYCYLDKHEINKIRIHCQNEYHKTTIEVQD